MGEWSKVGRVLRVSFAQGSTLIITMVMYLFLRVPGDSFEPMGSYEMYHIVGYGIVAVLILVVDFLSIRSLGKKLNKRLVWMYVLQVLVTLLAWGIVFTGALLVYYKNLSVGGVAFASVVVFLYLSMLLTRVFFMSRVRSIYEVRESDKPDMADVSK